MMDERHRFSAMGCAVVVAGGDSAPVAAVLERWEAVFSLFRPQSELSRVNRSQARVLAVSPLFALGLEAALGAAALPGGHVHPMICGRWGAIDQTGPIFA